MKKSLLSALIIFSTLLHIPAALAIDLNENPQVRHYIDEVAQQYNYNKQDLNRWFSQIEFNPGIIESMQKPGEAKPWPAYYRIFMQPERIQKGKAYWQTHAKALKAAEHQYGVPAHIIIGILGAETYYGKIKGKSPVLEALATIAFKYPPRSQYFRSELTEFLLLSREQGWNPLEIQGSYAGAMGLPQFMPSSYRTYAVAGSRNDYIDLFDNHQDVISSVGNYLSEKGWHRKEPIVVPAKVLSKHQEMTEKEADGKLRYTLPQLAKMGFTPAMSVPRNLKVGLLGFETEQGMEYWITFHNFQIIKRYNNSPKYALVVDLLGEAVKRQKR